MIQIPDSDPDSDSDSDFKSDFYFYYDSDT